MGKSRKIRNVTASYLEKAALSYLERFASSRANLRRILQRRVERAARDDPDCEPASFAPVIEDLVERLARSGLIDDTIYAAGKIRTLLRRGTPSRGVRMALAAKGVEAEIIDSTFSALRDERSGHDLDLEAGLALARRRRLGPFRVSSRSGKDAAVQRSHDLAVMGRAGFSYDIARRVIDGQAEDV